MSEIGEGLPCREAHKSAAVESGSDLKVAGS